jgi:hypothetical protein
VHEDLPALHSERNMNCSYCSDPAKGYDADGEPTCGSPTCEPVATPLPRVIEVSGEDSGEDDDAGET